MVQYIDYKHSAKGVKTMIINVEFFDENPIENVITSLNYKVDKTLFFGYQDVSAERKNSVTRFLKKVCSVQEVEFCAADDTDLSKMIDTISEKVKQEMKVGHQVFFDLTGGESLLLVAFGILSRELKAPMHKYDIYKNKIYEYGYDGCSLLSEAAKNAPIVLNLDSFISLYGGTINYRMHKDFKDTLSQEEINDIEKMWSLSRKYSKKWVHYSGLLRKFVPDHRLSVRVEAKQFLAELKKNSMVGNATMFHQFLEDCEAIGLLKSVCHSSGVYTFTYKNAAIKNYFWDGGSILEMYTFLKESQKGDSNDCRVGVHIDWDGVINNIPGKDILNEIDIMSIENNLPTFISCKIGNVDQMSLYELETVANRFGGKYAKKVLVIAKEMAAGHLLRAKEMGIEVRLISEEN